MKKRQTEDPRLFDRQKSSVLESSDLSRKGNVDKDIRDLLEKMNSNKNYFSLSSCSGRIIILRQQTHSKVKLFNNMALVYYRGRVFFGVFWNHSDPRSARLIGGSATWPPLPSPQNMVSNSLDRNGFKIKIIIFRQQTFKSKTKKHIYLLVQTKNVQLIWCNLKSQCR